MTQPSQAATVLRFGVFEADLLAGELRRNGHRLRVQEKPFQVLAILLERPGEVVTKEELQERLWPDVTVDADGGLNEAVFKLRKALEDSAQAPRYVETVPKRGYRFIAAIADPPPEPAPKIQPHLAPRPHRWALGGLLGIALLAVAGWTIRSPEPASSPQIRRFTIRPEQRLVRTMGPSRMVSVSPNGRYIAYVTYPPSGRDGLRAWLWVHDLETGRSSRVEGVEYAKSPFWSPDSAFLFFGRQQPVVEIHKLPMGGGPAIKVSDVPGLFREGSASSEGTIYFQGGSPGAVWTVAAGGGNPRSVLSEDEIRGMYADSSGSRSDMGEFPIALPRDGPARGLVFGVFAGRRVMVLDFETRKIRPLPITGRDVCYSPTGHLLYVDPRNDLWALPFSAETLEAQGDPFRVLERVVSPTVSDDGTLVYFDAVESSRQMVWRDRAGKTVETLRDGEGGAISDDGSKIALSGGDRPRETIEIHDLAGGPTVRISKSSFEIMPVWSPDGKEVAFASARGEDVHIFTKRTGSDDEPIPLLQEAGRDFPEDWSPHGRYLIFNRNEPFGGPGLSKDLLYAERNPNTGEWAEKVLRQTRSSEHSARFSPDGRYYVYASNEAGQQHIIVREFPSGGRRWIVSGKGEADRPRWSKESGEIFYVANGTLFCVKVSTASEFRHEEPMPLFPVSAADLFDDVTADGQRFLFASPPLKPAEPQIQVVQNWYEEFRKRYVVEPE